MKTRDIVRVIKKVLFVAIVVVLALTFIMPVGLGL
jgi:hypothetical protein